MMRDFIHERSGMYFAESKMYLLKNRLERRMAALSIGSFRDYFYHVKYDTTQREFQHLINVITTNETSFFRYAPQLTSFSDEALPQVMAGRGPGPRTLRVWSAGCSTGEEPYTLAMLILEKFRSAPGWTAEIIAGDISDAVLQKARRGEYRGTTMRNVPPALLAGYFTRNGDAFAVKPEVRGMVKFGLLNLSDERMLSLQSNFDVIFCRNVMIYFSDEVKRRLARGFYNALRPGGYLYIGPSETMHGVSKAFKLVYFKNALVYRKEAAGAPVTGPAAPKADGASGTARAGELLGSIRARTKTEKAGAQG